MHKGLFFTISVANKIFKTFFTKRDLIRYYYLINIYIAYWNRAFMFGKFLFFYFSITEIYNFLSIFIHTFTIFYIFTIYLPFFLLNQHFAVNLQLKKFLYQKIQLQDSSLKKYKIALSRASWCFSFNLFFIKILRRIFKVTSNISNHVFFSMYLHSLKNTYRYVSYAPKIESSHITAKQVYN